jgi:photoactive yellow protein
MAPCQRQAAGKTEIPKLSLITESLDTVSGPAGQDIPAQPGFTDPGLFDWLLAAAGTEIDVLPFGVITMAVDGTVEHYNVTEGKLAGLTPSRVVGRHYFNSVAPCMNNFLVAHRFEMESDIDTIIDYVLTLRMAPTKVRMRLLKRSDARQMHIIIERRI